MNPILCRELRGFAPRLRDWRLWLGVPLPRQPREWGLPAVAWYTLAPYVQWVLLLALRRADASLLQFASPSLLFSVFIVGLGFYACAVSVVVGATTITREREQATWDQVIATPLKSGELAQGYWLGGAGPIVLGVTVSLGGWLLLYPHYLALLEPLGSFEVTAGDLCRFGLLLGARVMALNAVGLAISTLCRRSTFPAAAGVTVAVLIVGAEIGLYGFPHLGPWASGLAPTLAGYAALTALALHWAAIGMRE
jgi:hypothetical protein